MFATYVHDLNPVALPIYKSLSLKWYGLAYLMGFVCGFLLLRSLARRKLWVLAPEKTADFIAAAALFGVFIGGRLGYVFFYQLPKHGWHTLLEDPLMILRVWEGGMASHGGILGLMIFAWFYARKHNVTWTGLGDGLCVVAPLGLLFGRMANFINGELFGRVADGVAWAVKFPKALIEQPNAEGADFGAAMQAASQVAEPLKQPFAAWQADQLDGGVLFEQMLAVQRHDSAVSKAIEPFLLPRHPSQLYEGLLEGLALFIILYVVRIRFPKAPDGLLTGLFFFFYAIFRIFGEQFREPDAAMVGPLTKGQFYSFFMFAAAAGFFVHAWRKRLRVEG